MAILVGEKITRFFEGDRYVFERIDVGKWECIESSTDIIPPVVVAGLPD